MRAQQWPRGRTSTDQRGLAFALRRRRAAVFLACREDETGRRQRCTRRLRLPALPRGCSTSLQARHGPRRQHERTTERQHRAKTNALRPRVCLRIERVIMGTCDSSAIYESIQRSGREPRGLACKTCLCLDRCEANKSIWLLAWASRRSRLIELDSIDRLQVIGQPKTGAKSRSHA